MSGGVWDMGCEEVWGVEVWGVRGCGRKEPIAGLAGWWEAGPPTEVLRTNSDVIWQGLFQAALGKSTGHCNLVTCRRLWNIAATAKIHSRWLSSHGWRC